jgi:predicted MFS family arabinose efflux permease
MANTDRQTYLVCIGLSLGVAIALGFGRFAYALILPAMQTDLGWSFTEAGLLNSANALGHLVGALCAIVLIARFGAVATIITTVFLTGAGIAATPLYDRFDYLLVMRFLPGLTGAMTFVAGGALAARAASRLQSNQALGVGLFYAGPGIGIVLSAVLVTPFVGIDVSRWPWAWYAMGAASLAGAVLVAAAALAVDEAVTPTERLDAPVSVSLAPALLGYGFFATGYVGYITFIVANVRETGGTALNSALWWGALGLGGIVAVALWSRMIDRSSNGRALAILTALTGIASVLPLLNTSWLGLCLSFFVFGACFLSVVAATTNLVRLARPTEVWARWIGYFTLAFGIGQTIGPTLSGMAADWVGSTDGVLVVSSALLFAGAAIAALQKRVVAD